MPPKTLPHVKRVKARGKVYHYFDTGVDVGNGRGGTKRVYSRLPDIRDPRFANSYAAAQGARTKRANAQSFLTVAKLIDLYQRSPQFRKLSEASQKLYCIYHAKVADLIGNAPADAVEPRDVRRIMDGMADTPGAANALRRVMGPLYRWARQRQHVSRTTDPIADVDVFESGEHQPWPQAVIDAALASDDARVRLPVALLLYTAQRIGDVMRMRWADIESGAIVVRQSKTGKALVVPMHRRLAAELDRTPRTGMTIITGDQGQPITDQYVRIALKKHCATFGLDLVPHGLRKNAVIALLESGCSIAETASISGQSFAMVEHYAKQRDQGKLATAAILKWERNAI